MQLFFEISQENMLISASKNSFSLLLGQLDNIINRYSIVVDKPRADNKQGPASACVTVDTDTSSIFKSHIKYVHYSHHMLEGCTCHILPAFAKTVDTMLVEMFGDITEAHIWYNPVATVRMLIIMIATSPGSCKLRIAFMFFSLNLA